MSAHNESEYMADYNARIEAELGAPALRRIHLTGSLAAAAGADLFEFEVARPCELFRALCSQRPECLPIFRDSSWRIHDADGVELDLLALFTYRSGRQPDLFIVPAPVGAGDSGVGKIFGGLFLAFIGLGPLAGGILGGLVSGGAIAGTGALMAISGLSQLLAPTAASNFMDREPADVRQSSIFTGATTLTKPGQAVPVVYGTARTGGVRASTLVKNQRVYTWGSDIDLVSGSQLDTVDILSEGVIEGISGDRDGILLDGVPVSTALAGDSARGLVWDLVDGASTTTASPSTVSTIYSVNQLCDTANAVELTITDVDVTRAIVTLEWGALFHSTSSVPPESTAVEFDLEISAAGGAFQDASAAITEAFEEKFDYGSIWGASVWLWHYLGSSGFPPPNTAEHSPTAVPVFTTPFVRTAEVSQTGAGGFDIVQISLDLQMDWAYNAVTPGGSGAWPPPDTQILNVLWSGSTTTALQTFPVTMSTESQSWAPAAGGVAYTRAFRYGVTIDVPAQATISVYLDTPSSADRSSSFEILDFRARTNEGKIEGRALSPYQVDLDIADLSQYGAAPYVVRVTRTTADQAADALSRDQFKVARYAEIIEANLFYTDTALVKIEGQSDALGGSLPKVDYLVDGLKIRIPTGYTLGPNSMPATWAGTFQGTRQFCNDPAWVLYDLLTSRYGLDLADADVDKWSFAEASRRNCDLVNDWKGGTEIRYAFNSALTRREQAFKILQAVATSMDALIWVGSGVIYLTQDRPGSVGRVFTEANVIGGRFEYTGTAATGRPTVARVSWRDPAQLYDETVETVERQYGIDRYGRREVDVDAPGVTSLGQAMRRGKYLLLTNERETQQIRFKIGAENALMTPGELVEIQDSHRTGSRFGGRIVSSVMNSATSSTFDVDADPAAAGIQVGDGFSTTLDDGSYFGGTISIVTGPSVNPAFSSTIIVSAGNIGRNADARAFVTTSASADATVYRVIAIAEDEPGVYEVSAAEHDPTKWTAIEDPTETGSAYSFPADTWPPP